MRTRASKMSSRLYCVAIPSQRIRRSIGWNSLRDGSKYFRPKEKSESGRMESNEVLGKHGRSKISTSRRERISLRDETRHRFLLAIPRCRIGRQTQTQRNKRCSSDRYPFSKRCKLICAWRVKSSTFGLEMSRRKSQATELCKVFARKVSSFVYE